MTTLPDASAIDGHLDLPAENPAPSSGQVQVEGWILPRSGRIRRVWGRLAGREAELDFPLVRRDVAAAFPARLDAQLSGFAGHVPAPSKGGLLEVHVLLDSGQQLCRFSRIIPPSSPHLSWFGFLSRVLGEIGGAESDGRFRLASVRWRQQLRDLYRTLLGYASQAGAAFAPVDTNRSRSSLARPSATASEPADAGKEAVTIAQLRTGRCDRRRKSIVVTSNCQTGGLAACFKILLHESDIVAAPLPTSMDSEEAAQLRSTVAKADVWVVTGSFARLPEFVRPNLQTIKIPDVVFRAFHPDLIYALRKSNGEIIPPVEHYNSSLVLWAWDHGLPLHAAQELFCKEIYRELGFLDAWQPAVDNLRKEFSASDIEFTPFYLRVKRLGNFMHSINHPKMPVLQQIATQVAVLVEPTCALLGDPCLETVPDALARSVWPLYPEIAARYSLPGSFVWKLMDNYYYGIEEFVAREYELYRTLELKRGDIDYAGYCGQPFFATLAKMTGSAP